MININNIVGISLNILKNFDEYLFSSILNLLKHTPKKNDKLLKLL